MTIDIDNVIEIKMEKFVITREHVRKKLYLSLPGSAV